MKQFKLTFLLTVLMSMVGTKVFAYDAMIDGIYYNFDNETYAASVTFLYNTSSNKEAYSGNVVIPESVAYNSVTYRVTSIEENAFEYCSNLTTVTIPNSVTVIGKSAFNGCSGLISVTIPNSITTINDYTFNDCNKLVSITIPNNVTEIGSRAFAGCSSLTSLTIPNSVNNIGAAAMQNCRGLKSLTIPNSVTYIGGNAFQWCTQLSMIVLPSNITVISSQLFDGCSNLTSINMPNTVTTIEQQAFQNCNSLSSITLPQSVTALGWRAFYNCGGLSSISIPLGVNKIEEEVFFGCKNLTSINVESGNITYDSRNNCNAIIETATNTLLFGCQSTIIPEGVIAIGDNAFNGCSNLTSIIIPNSLTTISSSAFQNCTGLSTIEFHANQIRNWFSGFKSITDVIIGSDVQSIVQRAFYNCTNLSNIAFPESLVEIGFEAFANTAWYKNQGNGPIYIGNSLYEYKGTMPEGTIFTIKEGTQQICDGVFSGCNGLTSVIIPQSVSIIGASSFSGCSGLTSIAIPNSVTVLGNSAFYNCSGLTSLSIGNSVATIELGTFEGCSNLKTITIEDGVTPLKFNATYQSNQSKPNWFPSDCLETAYIGRDLDDSYLVQGWGTYHYSPFIDKITLQEVTFGDNVTCILNGMFKGCTNLTLVNMSTNVNTIGISAFSECENLSAIVIPNGVKEIGNSTFQNCKSLQSINLPETVESLGEQSFLCCTGLKELVIPSSVTSIMRGAFMSCSNLSNLVFEDGSEPLTIREESFGLAFAGCPISNIYLGRNIINNSYNYIYSSLASFNTPLALTISKNVTELSGGTFANCNKITTITFEEGADTLKLVKDHNATSAIMPFANTQIDSVFLGRVIIGTDRYYPTSSVVPFSSSTSPFAMRIANNIKEIGLNLFLGWKISSVIIPSSVEFIGNSAFKECIYLKSLTIEDSTEPLDFSNGGNFYGCPLDNIYLGRNMLYTTESPFKYNKERPKTLTFSNHVTELGDVDFYGHVGITALTLPNSLKKIGKQTFYGCDGLTTLSIPNSVEEIGERAFDMCTALKSVTIEDGTGTLSFVASEGQIINTFTNSPLEEVYLGRNINFPNLSPFCAQESLATLTIGEKVNNISNKAFTGCKSLTNVVSYANAVPTTGQITFTPSYLPNATLHVPYALYDQYRITPQWKDFGKIKNFEGKYNLTYLVDDEEYLHTVLEQGSAIIPEAEPTKEGYTFSGWSEIPETMPDHDLTITGTFSVNSYKLIYVVDGEAYKTYDVNFGTTITPERAPTKEGYTFSGWSEIPETMPAHDVTVTGSFTVNKYKLTYMVDGEEYKSYEVEYGTNITPEAEPTKEHYTFSGWSEIPETMPAHDVTVTGSFSINKYRLTYTVDGEEYKSYEVEYGANITPETEPTKEGYTFSGWSEIPETMPAHDVVITGTFSINKYKLTYTVDGEKYKSYEVEYGANITPEAAPTKEGYTFSGWSEIPETMPAHDVTVTGSFTINKYKLTYTVEGEEYKSYEVEYGATITPEAEPTKEGYTFSGWSEIPETMPAHDVTVTGSFTINQYIITYIIDGEVYMTESVDFNSAITPPTPPAKDGYDFAWGEYPETMPAHDITIEGSYTTGIYSIDSDDEDVEWYTLNGLRIEKPGKGTYIMRKNGMTRKVVVK